MAQTGVVRGNVYDKDSGDPVIYCNIFLDGTTIGVTSDLDGFFTIPNVPAGEYNLMVSYIGYDTISVPINVRTNDIVYERIFLEESSVQLQAVNVSARKAATRTEVSVSKVTVTAKELKALPSIGGEADIAQYIQVLPGVVSTGDQGGQIYIRGGAPIQNKVLLDGMTIYNPFHSIGFFSVFETETVRSVDVLTGGFNAEYGGRISAVVDIKTREGNKKRLSGVVSGNPFQSKVLLEGPIKKLNEETGSSTSFMITGKRSYIDKTSPTLYPYATESAEGLPYNFTDFYGKVSMLSGNGSKLNVFGFNHDDRVNFTDLANLKWNAYGGGIQFNLIPSSSDLIIKGSVAYSDYNIELEEALQEPRTSGINGFNIAMNFSYYGDNNDINYGFDVNGFGTDFKFRNFSGITLDQFQNTTEIAGYFKYKQIAGPLVIEPGLRVQYYASLNNFSVEPRLGLKWNITDDIRFKLAAGLYSQNLISTVNERDIVNLFVGFLSGPEETIYKLNTTEPTDHRLQKSRQGIVGLEFDLMEGLEFNVETYYKDFNQLISVNRNKLDPTDPDFITETGDAYGLDFLVKYETRRTYLWATYSLAYVNRFDGVQTFPTVFDRRHNVNLLGTYKFGDGSWEAGARWNLGSGFPFTKTQGFYSDYNFLDGINTDYISENANLGIIYDEERNGGRLPYYHRLDLSLKKKIEISRNMSLEAVASVTNAYNRNNIFYFDRVTYSRVDQLPILPSLGLTFTF